MATARCTIDGATLLFRLPSLDEVDAYLADARARPGDQLEIGLALARECCLEGPIDLVCDARPLALIESVLPQLFATRSKRTATVRRAAIARWKRSETDLARMADSLLAFHGHRGGEPSEAAFAGALHVAEWLDSTRGLFRLFSAFMKALARRR